LGRKRRRKEKKRDRRGSRRTGIALGKSLPLSLQNGGSKRERQGVSLPNQTTHLKIADRGLQGKTGVSQQVGAAEEGGILYEFGGTPFIKKKIAGMEFPYKERVELATQSREKLSLEKGGKS